MIINNFPSIFFSNYSIPKIDPFLRSLPNYVKQIQQIRFDKYSSEWLSSHRGKTEAESQHGSCTGSFQNLENPKEIFVNEDFKSLKCLKSLGPKWGIESRHGSHASFRYWMNEDDIILNLVPWYARTLWKCRHPIVYSQVSPGSQEI